MEVVIVGKAVVGEELPEQPRPETSPRAAPRRGRSTGLLPRPRDAVALEHGRLRACIDRAPSLDVLVVLERARHRAVRFHSAGSGGGADHRITPRPRPRRAAMAASSGVSSARSLNSEIGAHLAALIRILTAADQPHDRRRVAQRGRLRQIHRLDAPQRDACRPARGAACQRSGRRARAGRAARPRRRPISRRTTGSSTRARAADWGRRRRARRCAAAR